MNPNRALTERAALYIALKAAGLFSYTLASTDQASHQVRFAMDYTESPSETISYGEYEFCNPPEGDLEFTTQTVIDDNGKTLMIMWAGNDEAVLDVLAGLASVVGQDLLYRIRYARNGKPRRKVDSILDKFDINGLDELKKTAGEVDGLFDFTDELLYI